jgi:hypothetical protein
MWRFDGERATEYGHREPTVTKRSPVIELLGPSAALFAALVVVGCTMPGTRPPPSPGELGADATPVSDPYRSDEEPAPPEDRLVNVPSRETPAPTETASTANKRPVLGPAGPRVSASAGIAGGVVLLWPRIIPYSEEAPLRPVAAGLQRRLRKIIEKELPGRTIDQRPEPERVCPSAGCAGVGVGVLLATSKGGCVAVAFTNRPGITETQLAPWSGDMDTKTKTVPFRGKPEEAVTIRDFIPCDDLLNQLEERQPDVELLIRNAGR